MSCSSGLRLPPRASGHPLGILGQGCCCRRAQSQTLLTHFVYCLISVWSILLRIFEVRAVQVLWKRCEVLHQRVSMMFEKVNLLCQSNEKWTCKIYVNMLVRLKLYQVEFLEVGLRHQDNRVKDQFHLAFIRPSWPRHSAHDLQFLQWSLTWKSNRIDL